jgi:hypothetical protein
MTHHRTVTEVGVKFSSPPYLLQLDLFAPVKFRDARHTVHEASAIITMPKARWQQRAVANSFCANQPA